MLSILIPIFNFDIRPLVADLHGQCEALGIGYEIVCFDDGSTAEFKAMNQKIWKLPNVIYQEMPQNLGRSAIRNALGKAARFDYLLFMDCDSKVVSPDFIEKYLEAIALGGRSKLPPNSNAAGFLVYGGRCYSDLPPHDKSLFFHWHYGKNREQTTAAERSRSPYHGFMTNNFLISKQTFLGILFDETLRQYGHEDTLFGMELKKRNVPIIHIDNPLEHIGLETVEVFLKKTTQGIENLFALRAAKKPIETRLLNTYESCKRWGLTKVIERLRPLFYWLIIKDLMLNGLLLLLFDGYKLATLCRIVHAKPE
jgi:glycosyltransferase involved in cell wall biosynthesis